MIDTSNSKAIRMHMIAADRWFLAAKATEGLREDGIDDSDVIPWMEAIEATKQAQAVSADPIEIPAALAWIQHTLDEGIEVEKAEAIDQAKDMSKKHREWIEQLRQKYREWIEHIRQ